MVITLGDADDYNNKMRLLSVVCTTCSRTTGNDQDRLGWFCIRLVLEGCTLRNAAKATDVKKNKK